EQIQHERREATRLQFTDQVIPQGKKVKDITECAELLIVTSVKSGAGVKVNRWLFLTTDAEAWSKITPENAHTLLGQWLKVCGLTDSSTALAKKLQSLTEWVRTEKYKTYLSDILPILRKHLSEKEMKSLNI
ncbi:MAG: hypothetical protein RQ743_13960, partial [Bacteroidales bacterium]|nr:hypothetical protein [Bacteroidales bacterium]